LGIDVGGTFTDFVLIDELSGELVREKCLTTPRDPIIGIMEGVKKLSERTNSLTERLTGIGHATTLVTNTVIERNGAETGLLCTEGFKDVLELGRDMRYDMYDLGIEFPQPLVKRSRRIGVNERVAADGVALHRPTKSDVCAKVRMMMKDGVTSVAVCFLHSYRNAANEKLVQAWIREEFPDLEISISSEVAPEIREFERSVTVAANAYVKPLIRAYLNRLEGAFLDAGATAQVLVMLSNGGMATPRSAAEIPIRMIESGPAAGVRSACYAGARIDESKIIAFDMGGTTAKACFIDSGEPAFTGTFEAARVKRQFRGSGMPLKIASVEMIEIGAGGGSIARIDETGLLKVGPQSAGASPGPVCYGRGGEQPTVTDADLVLGYLDPGHFLGGDMPLNLERTQIALKHLGKNYQMSDREVAAGIAEVVNQNMATAVRIHAAERGKDYQRYALFAIGGAGPVHAYEVARILGIGKIICPLGAGTNSAFGLLAAPVAVDLSRSYNVNLEGVDWGYLNGLFDEIEGEGHKFLTDAGVRVPKIRRRVDMRFVGQGFELSVPVPSGKLGPNSAKPIRKAFYAEYMRIYDSIPGHLPVEAITWRLRASGPAPRLQVMASKAGTHAARKRGSRKAYFPEKKQYLDCRVIDRYSLAAGDVVVGPAIVEERESTTVIGPRGRATVDADLNFIIQIRQEQ